VTGADSLERRVREFRYRYEGRAGAARQLAQDGLRVQAEVDRLQGEVDLHAKVNSLLTSLGEQAQAQAQERLEQLVTRGLQVVFGSELSFHVVQSVKAGQVNTDFMIRSSFTDVTVDTPVMEARGGGMAAVVGFMVRLVVLLLTPRARRILFLDESFSHVSREYETRVAEFLREVAVRAGVQIVLSTHSDAYYDAADVRYRMNPGADGMAEIERF
jgi:ABC-type uncharacterized transport system YnjBCD ATPase subunit